MRSTSGPITHRRHKKVLDKAKGFSGARRTRIKAAREGVFTAGRHAYKARKARKADFRSLWITRINAAVRLVEPEYSYSQFMHGLKQANILINRKVLADLAVKDSAEFSRLVQIARRHQ